MSDAPALLVELRKHGVTVRVVDDGLRYRPASRVGPGLRERLAACKAELIALVEYFEERAAIRQYDAGFTREDAERLALEDVLAKARAAS